MFWNNSKNKVWKALTQVKKQVFEFRGNDELESAISKMIDAPGCETLIIGVDHKNLMTALDDTYISVDLIVYEQHCEMTFDNKSSATLYING